MFQLVEDICYPSYFPSPGFFSLNKLLVDHITCQSIPVKLFHKLNDAYNPLYGRRMIVILCIGALRNLAASLLLELKTHSEAYL